MTEAGASSGGARHVLVVANETVAGAKLIETLRSHAEEIDLVTVLCPINRPRDGYVVYEDTRRAAAGRRLDRTLAALRDAGISAHGLVVEANPVDAVRDALEQADPPITAVVVSTHPLKKSGWMRKNVVDRIRAVVADLSLEHVVVDLKEEQGETNVLVVANETVVDDALLDRIRERSQRERASFLIVCPQSDPTASEHPEAERRLRRALTLLRGEGIEVHGQIAHPDPFAATMQAVRDERVDEILISTFPAARSRWLRRGDLVERIKRETKLPVEHVVVEPDRVAGVAS